MARVKKPSGEGKDRCMSTSSTKKATAKKPDFLRHYTSIEFLYKILDSGYLLLSDPGKKWEDQNDVAAVRAFCRIKGNGTEARAVCFLDGEESISHWKTFAEEEGCCISFDRNEILKQVKGTDFLHGPVEYKREIKANELKKLIPKNIKKIPFIKRNPYKCEEEYRIIWFGTGEVPKIHFKREKAIKSITLSPWISDIDREKIKKHIEEKYDIKAQFSRILALPELIRIFENLGKPNPKKRKPQKSRKS
ncbi:MAG: DUF2971 domain-containing protein [Fibromonadales bacterium]|nr:DUF2971 domain-containing protein [Fibromonadales bacterium]